VTESRVGQWVEAVPTDAPPVDEAPAGESPAGESQSPVGDSSAEEPPTQPAEERSPSPAKSASTKSH
jgi:hypothetical protein